MSYRTVRTSLVVLRFGFDEVCCPRNLLLSLRRLRDLGLFGVGTKPALQTKQQN
jgi:hypothetical protein